MILFITLEVMSNKILTKKDLSARFEVSPKTISRYISEINVFYSNFYLPYYIQYCQTNKGYKMFYTRADNKK